MGSEMCIRDRSNSVINWNGDDTIVLRKNGAVIDAIGQVGTDPGSEWNVNGVGTQNETIRRLDSVCAGDADETDVFDPSAEWTSFANDSFDGLGSHTVNCGNGGGPSITELFFSEYVEGSGFNKAIELYNGTGGAVDLAAGAYTCLLYTSPSPRDGLLSRMPSSA